MSKANYDVYQRLLQLNGLKTADVCAATGLNSSTISHWKSGLYAPKNDKISKIAEFFDIPPWAFFGDVDDLESYLDQGRGAPLHDVSAGQGRMDSQYETYKEEGQLAKVIGDSMSPILLDGDVVRFVEDSDVGPNDIALVRIDGESLMAKFVEWTDDGMWIRAANTSVFADRFYTAKEIATIPVQVVGKAVEVRRKL